tara:strand:- start:8499 stop:9263 length:765 start_codon:yes stop_codon:yes gene_type:complete
MTSTLELRSGAARKAGKALFHDIDITLAAGQFACLLGPNGAGKSSLLRALTGLQPLDIGEVTLMGAPLATMSTSERARRVSYLPQTRPLAWPIEVEQAIALGRFAYGAQPGRLSSTDAAAVQSAIQQCGLTGFETRRTDTLSGGELARVHIARALASEAPVMLVDEPLAALDPRHQLRIMTILKEYCEQGGCVLAVLHDVSLAARYADRLLWMKEGKIESDGTPAETLTPATMADVFEVDVTISDGLIRYQMPA